MTDLPFSRGKIFFALTGLLFVAGTLWLPVAYLDDRSPSPLRVAQMTPEGNGSPLPTPTLVAVPSSVGSGRGLVLLWVAVGVVLALGITFIFVLQGRRAA